MNQIDDLNTLKNMDAKSPRQMLDAFMQSLSFDDTVKQIAALKAMIFNVPDINQAKIQFIKEEIAAGRYQIQSTRIAQKLTEYNQSMKEPEIA
ncbi:flagellar biosynthesis anti-sigma factor FlgM [Legionella oakridgensis]|uniref:Negative regulator of flagellin synthesis n=2 Tax=Legionella oakridgensis TaxID=29423 RepID=W0B8Y7_9GAMM|nr:flagellar biosynthesis anti-sigma factor FlgM [Legionella oakridgensis]AHE67008.1 flagellar biosynthesis anti-sigma factor FlgM [Legionella oakridgensis ATCC 33761 = DSM 21215]ETO93365.1 anti-sigma-28 factor, FlgM family [Legionella oakridgensis RV-2-2007]KTD38341.1 flagellin synthesis negative regulator [Legionella oakridgensis]STY20106.1 negative regulator of flagellin synthesis FlgM [Legionella longbeachae]